MKRIVFATENPGKLREVREFARRYGYEVLSPSEAGLMPVEVEETGSTYEENARLKVQAYLEQPAAKELIICGDDTGAEIPALNNEPGIHTRRWLGYRMSDDEIIGYTLGRMHDIKDRRAVFKVTVAYSIYGGEMRIATGQTEGEITEKPLPDAVHEKGVPFRVIFQVGDPPIPYWKFHDMSLEERGDKLSHREAAFKQVFEALDTILTE
jgi:XTP/dITP diphosphohydrolase